MMMLVIAIVIMMMIKFFRYICNCSVSVRTILATVRHDRTHTQASVLLLLAFRSLLFLHCVCCIWRNYFLHRLHYLVICCIIFVLPPTKDYVLMCTLFWFACNFAFVAFVASHFCIRWVCRMFFCICCICICISKTFTDCTILNVLSSDPRSDQNASFLPAPAMLLPFYAIYHVLILMMIIIINVMIKWKWK